MPKLSVFVACPYSLFPLDDYKRVFFGIQRTDDVAFKFADEQITNEHILKKISDYIRDHDFSLFDITGWNANVALELGIAVGLGKKYFILFNSAHEKGRDVPSDIQGIERIQYKSNSELEAKLRILLKQEINRRAPQNETTFDILKRKIIDCLAETPGLSISQVAGIISDEKSLVGSTMRALISSNDLRTEGQKRGTKYFIQESDVNIATQDKVLKRIQKEPGLGLREIADRCALSKDTARNALRILQKDGKIKISGSRRTAVYVLMEFDLRTLRSSKKINK